MKSAIYQIRNLLNSKRYIGSSKNLKERWRDHKYRLGKGTHVSTHLQNAWNKYGKHSFIFEVIEETTELLVREEFYIKQLDTTCQSKGYNIIGIANGRNVLSPEIRAKISESHQGKKNPFYGRKHSQETKDKISQNSAGEKNPHAILNWKSVKEIRQKYSNGNYTQKQLAIEYDTTRPTINDVVAGRSWKDVNYKKTEDRRYKLSVSDKQEIRRSNKSNRELAELYNVSKITITRTRNPRHES